MLFAKVPECAATRTLGFVECRIGTLEELIAVAPVQRRKGSADRNTDLHRGAFDRIGRTDARQKLLGDLGRYRSRRKTGQQDSELVASQPCYHVARADAAAHPLRGLHEQLIA